METSSFSTILSWKNIRKGMTPFCSIDKGLGKQNFYIQFFLYHKCLFYFWYSFSSFPYPTKIFWWWAKETGLFLHHIFFINKEQWTIFFPLILILKWFTINRRKLIENRLGILIFTHQNSVCPCPQSPENIYIPKKIVAICQ